MGFLDAQIRAEQGPLNCGASTQDPDRMMVCVEVGGWQNVEIM